MKTGAALIALAAAVAFVPIPNQAVERFYSGGVFAAIQPLVTSLSNLSPVAILDVLIIAVMAVWLLLAIRDIVRRKKLGWLRVAGRFVFRTVVWTSALYLAFLVMWGLNYRRVPLLSKLPYDARLVTPDAAQALARTSVDELNRLYDAAHAAGWVDEGAIDRPLAEALVVADRDVRGAGAGAVVPGRPKRTLLNWYFQRAAVEGMTDPYFLETLVVSDLLPFERPFVMAHEWSHLAGLADEGEANFLGWLACVRSGVAEQYSGWLFMYAETAAGLRGQTRDDVMSRLGPGPRADLVAMRERVTRHINRACPRRDGASTIATSKPIASRRARRVMRRSYGSCLVRSSRLAGA